LPHPPKQRAGKCANTYQPYTADSYPVKEEESTMQDHVITDTQTEPPYITITLTRSNVTPEKWKYLRKWAKRLNVSLEELLRRILVAGILGQLYAEKIPES
jgi:hypothetical protein